MDPPQDEVISPMCHSRRRGLSHADADDDEGHAFILTTGSGQWIRQREHLNHGVNRKGLSSTNDKWLQHTDEPAENNEYDDTGNSIFVSRGPKRAQQAVQTDSSFDGLSHADVQGTIHSIGQALDSQSDDGSIDERGGFTRPVVRYLTTIYTCVLITIAFSVYGAMTAYSQDLDEYEQVYGQMGNLALLIVMYSLPSSNRFLLLRTVMLAVFAYLEGLGLLNQLEISEGMLEDENTVSSIITGSLVIFGGATVAALSSTPTNDPTGNCGLPVALLIRLLSYAVLTILSVTLVKNSGNVGQWLFNVSPYVSLAISGSFVAVDTQLLAAKAAANAEEGMDPIKDAIMIYLDSVDIFRKMSVICKRRYEQALPVLPTHMPGSSWF